MFPGNNSKLEAIISAQEGKALYFFNTAERLKPFIRDWSKYAGDNHLHTPELLPKVFYLTGKRLMHYGLKCPGFRWMSSEERHEMLPTSCQSQIEENCNFNTIVSES